MNAFYSFTFGMQNIETWDSTTNILDMPLFYDENEKHALDLAIEYTWSLTSEKILNLFQNEFRNNTKIYNTKNLNKEISLWCNNSLVNFFDEFASDSEYDPITNIGFNVKDTMKLALDKRRLTEIYDLNKSISIIEKDAATESINVIINSAKSLVEVQNKYINENIDINV